MYSSKKSFVFYFLMADTVILCLSVLSAIYYNDENFSRGLRLSFMLGLPTLWFLIVYWQKLYTDLHEHDFKRLIRFIKSCSILIFLLGLCYLFFSFPPKFRTTIVVFSLGFPLAGILVHFIIISVLNRWRHASRKMRSTLVIGYSEEGVKLNAMPDAVYHPSARGVQAVQAEVAEKISGDVQFMEKYLEGHHVEEIQLNLPVKISEDVRKILELADYHGARVKILPDLDPILVGDVKRGNLVKAVNLRPMPLDHKVSYFFKEAFDLVFASVVLVMLLPLFLVIAILIKLDSPRPVFYCPIRIGKNNRPFKLYKFSTMRDSDPVSGGVNSTQKDDPRITKLGRIMRKYSIDELPQFINVFLGDMSVVGPRPHRTFLNEQLQKSEQNYMIRHYYKPGITGWAQVNGWRGPTDTPERKRQRTLHDLWYLENWSFKLDLKIIWMTIFGKKTHESAF